MYNVQDVLAGFGATAGEDGIVVVTLVDDACERARFSVNLDRVPAIEREDCVSVDHRSASGVI